MIRIMVLLCATLAAFNTRAEGEQKFADLGACPLESGQEILECRIAYRTFGKLNADASNVLLFPTYHTGTSGNLVANGYVGPGLMADTDRFYVILVDALGDGVSSSPSNSNAQSGEAFPAFTIGDMVETQHTLLTQHLGIESVRVVLGVSMGGLQALEWMIRYPGFMQEVISVEGTPWPTSHDLLLWTAWMDAAATYDGSAESRERVSILLSKLDALTLWTPDHFSEMVSVDGYGSFMESFIRNLDEGQLQDRNYQTLAMTHHDIADGEPGFLQQARDLVKARLLMVVFQRDHMVNPEPSATLAEAIGASLHVLDSSCGHMTVTTACGQAEVTRLVHEFLEQ